MSASEDGAGSGISTGTAIGLSHPARVGGADFVPTAGRGDGRRRRTPPDLGRLHRRQIARFPRDREAALSVRFGPTGRTLLTAGSDGGVRLWNVRGGSCSRRDARPPRSGAPSQLRAARQLPGERRRGQHGAALVPVPIRARSSRAGMDGVSVGRGRPPRGRRQQLRAGHRRRRRPRHDSRARRVRERCDGPVLGRRQPRCRPTRWTVQLWGPSGARRRVPTDDPPKWSVASDAGPPVAFGDAGGRVTSGGRRLGKDRAGWPPRAGLRPELQPRREHLVAGSEDGTARIWDYAVAARSACWVVTGRRSIPPSRAGRSPAATAGADGTVRLWKLDNGGSVLCTATRTGAVRRVRGGELLVSAGHDGTIRIWEAP